MIGQKIKDARVERGLSQGELASAIGVDTSLISLWETGKCTPPPNRALALARVLDVAPKEFLPAEMMRMFQRILDDAQREVADVVVA